MDPAHETDRPERLTAPPWWAALLALAGFLAALVATLYLLLHYTPGPG